MQRFQYILLYFALQLALYSQAKDIVLTSGQEYKISNQDLEIFLDRSGKLTVEDIISNVQFIKNPTDIFKNSTEDDGAWWVKLNVINKSGSEDSWILESFNYRIDTLELFSPAKDGKYFRQKIGVTAPFRERLVKHKNLEFLIYPRIDQATTYYLRIVTHKETSFQFVIRSHVFFTNYALHEYFYLGLFYGMIVIVGIYNLFLFISVRDKAYLFYVLYVFSIGVFFMTHDGIGFQFLWGDFPDFNYHGYMFAFVSSVIFMCLYTRFFLPVKEYFPLLDKILMLFIPVRLILLIITIVFFPEIKHYLYIDFLPFIFCYITAIICYMKGFQPGIYFIAGFSILFLGFIVNTMRIDHVLPSNVVTMYIMNAATLTEMLLLSFALAEKIKLLRKKELINTYLRNVIREKREEMDEFLYKSSHDLRGPLKSIIGLTALGKKEGNEKSIVYFDHIFQTSKKLDSILNNLLSITKITRGQIKIEEIKFHSLIETCLETLKFSDGYNEVEISVELDQETPFYSDPVNLCSILQNIIENAFKYRRKGVTSFLRIKIAVNEESAKISLEDNGIGIRNEYHDKIFDMFFRLHSGQNSTGLGLYLVKVAVEKLHGKISFTSKYDHGTTFQIVLKNFYSRVKKNMVQN